MNNTRTIIITEVALAIALATVLNFLQIRLPINLFGGSINLSMLPIAIVALRRGVVSGMVAGTAFGFIDLLIEPYFFMPVQVLLDYPLPYMLFGFGVGLFSGLYNNLSAKAPALASKRFALGSLVIVTALIFGGLLRLASHVVSGVVFFAEYAADFFATNPTLLVAGPVDSGLNLWIYSVGYNLIYLMPSLIGSIAGLLLIAPVVAMAVPVRKYHAGELRVEKQAAE